MLQEAAGRPSHQGQQRGSVLRWKRREKERGGKKRGGTILSSPSLFGCIIPISIPLDRPSFLSRGQRASKKITFLPIEATYTHIHIHIYIYNIPRPLIEHTCIRARKIYTRRARAQTRVTARSLARLAGWVGWLWRAAERVHRFFLPPPALPGFSARYEATDKLSVPPLRSLPFVVFDVIHQKRGGEGGKDREGRRNDSTKSRMRLVNAGLRVYTFTSFPPRSGESFPSFSPFDSSTESRSLRISRT